MLFKTKIPSRRQVLQIILLLFVIVGCFGGVAWQQRQKHAVPVLSDRYDVIVVGAGPGGIAASLQAARMGAHVALLEETDWIGGQMTAAAVGTMDEGNNREARKSGIYAEFAKAVIEYYGARGHSTGTCYYYQGSLCVDPRDGQHILQNMLKKESQNLTVLTGVRVSSVIKHDQTVVGVVVNGKQLQSKVLIDAGEYGDVIAKSGAAYRIGNQVSTSQNDRAGCLQAITYSAVVKYYPNRVPSSLQFTKAPPGYTAATKKRFASILSPQGTNYLQTKKRPSTYQSYTAWRGLPDLSNHTDYTVLQQGQDITRSSLNLGNDWPPNGKVPPDFITDPTARKRYTCEAKKMTLQLLYYIQHDLGQSHWALADDEGYSTAYNRSHHCPSLANFVQMENQMPQMPYVREGRRIIGEQTLTGTDLNRPWTATNPMPQYNNSIAVGYYMMDLHGCNSPASLESNLDPAQLLTNKPRSGPFEVPMGVLIPQQVDGLLAAEKNISVSRLAGGAIREQPIAMNIGQAAGALAALATQRHEQPRDVPAALVRSALTKSGAVISVQ